MKNQEEHVLLVDKPLTWTSFDVVNKLRYAGNFKKIGHAGTLDPLATGLLILCTGKKTKEIDNFQALEKEYTGTFLLGASTPSFDLETEVDQTFPIEHITEEALINAAKQLTGKINQIPPVFSAIKVKGKRAYEAARKGQNIELKSREVFVEKFKINSSNFPEISFEIKCSKGTYIRSLVRDIGQILGSGAYLKSLKRTKIGEFSVDNALSIEEAIIKVKQRENLQQP